MTPRLRQHFKATSNNATNPNQNVCGQAVCRALGVADAVRYIHTMDDILRAARLAWSARSRMSKLGKRRSVGAARALCAKVAREEGARAFIASIKGHVLLLDHNGETLIDTAPRSRDRRQLDGLWAIFPKS